MECHVNNILVFIINNANNIVKYYYGTTENAVKVYEKAWNLEYHKDCLSNGKRKAYIELAAITLYKVFYGKFTST